MEACSIAGQKMIKRQPSAGRLLLMVYWKSRGPLMDHYLQKVTTIIVWPSFKLIITKADKGNLVIVLDASEYEEGVLALLSNSCHYKPLKFNPTLRLREDLRNILDIFVAETQDEELSKIHKNLRSSSNIRPSELYSLPKIHKPGVPLRPIVSGYNSIVSELCTYLKRILSPLTDDYMESYDVKDLFTSIPMNVTMDILEKLLHDDDTLHERTKLKPFHIHKLVSFFMFQANYFHFQKQCSSPTQGARMGSTLSLILGDIFMENVERIAFDRANPSIILRFHD
ncbi:hypothetical protein M513_00859 [Trichuris suis]|uniref:Reverse transcriptase domain-containing protein n=1 Tax=Trichuris suis TaxID=68888 RepID=A0A085MLK0_9BILA|nr:hypothetical protein M513_00859 [Trichuris suis]